MSCSSNFTTIISIKWTTSSNINFTTEMVGSQEIILNIVGVSRAFHDRNFTCEVVYMLQVGIVTSRINFRINTGETRKNHVN